MGLKLGLSRRCNPTDELCHIAELSHELSLVSAEALLDGETHRTHLGGPMSTRARR